MQVKVKRKVNEGEGEGEGEKIERGLTMNFPRQSVTK